MSRDRSASSEFGALSAGAASRVDLWSRIIDAASVASMAEVGVWRGDFSREILTRCTALQRYVMIDPWAHLSDWNKPYNTEQRRFDEIYAEAMQQTEFAASKREVLRGRTKDVAASIPDGSLDFVYIDGDHTLRGIAIDLIQLLPKVREGGLIGGDDFTPDPWQHDLRFEPTLVCPFGVYFAEAMDLPITALPCAQFVIEKRTGAGFSFRDLTGRYGDLSLNRLPSGRRRLAHMRSRLRQMVSPSH